MKTIVRISILSALLFSLAVPQMSFAGSVSGCSNGPNNAVDFGPPYGTVVYTQFACSLYPSASPYTIDLIPNMTYVDANGAANLYDNGVGAGYIVVINGDPGSLSNDSIGLWNQSLWAAVLYFPGDTLWGGTASDSLTVYYAGNSGFPTVRDVQTLDESMSAYYVSQGFDPIPDSDYFVQSGDPAVYAQGNNEYDIYPTPEPSSLLLLGSGLVGLAGVLRRKLRV